MHRQTSCILGRFTGDKQQSDFCDHVGEGVAGGGFDARERTRYAEMDRAVLGGGEDGCVQSSDRGGRRAVYNYSGLSHIILNARYETDSPGRGAAGGNSQRGAEV